MEYLFRGEAFLQETIIIVSASVQEKAKEEGSKPAMRLSVFVNEAEAKVLTVIQALVMLTSVTFVTRPASDKKQTLARSIVRMNQEPKNRAFSEYRCSSD